MHFSLVGVADRKDVQSGNSARASRSKPPGRERSWALEYYGRQEPTSLRCLVVATFSKAWRRAHSAAGARGRVADAEPM